jgi:hypothetical protein
VDLPGGGGGGEGVEDPELVSDVKCKFETNISGCTVHYTHTHTGLCTAARWLKNLPVMLRSSVYSTSPPHVVSLQQ